MNVGQSEPEGAAPWTPSARLFEAEPRTAPQGAKWRIWPVLVAFVVVGAVVVGLLLTFFLR